jgi:hypothetical protein
MARGLLDFQDPQLMGLLGISSGLLQAGGPSRMPMGLGHGIGMGLNQGMQFSENASQMQNRTAITNSRVDEEKRKAQQAAESQQRLSQFAATLPPDQQMRFMVDPKAFLESKVVAPGSSLVSGGGGVQYTQPNRPPDPTSDIRNFEYAKSQGFKGSLQDFILSHRSAGATNVTTNLGRDDDEYLKGRRRQQAEAFSTLEKGAESAYKQIQTLDRFREASKTGTAGGAQPIISGVQNFLSTFGYTPEQLKDVRVMEQAIGDILGNKMNELGARGLTDKDMEILRQSLPRVALDRDSREAVSNILKKSHEFTLEQYEEARAEESRIYPDFAKKTPVQGWLKGYRTEKQKRLSAPTTEAPAVKPPAVVNWNDLGR